MPTNLLTSNTLAANSADIVIAANEELTVALKGTAGDIPPSALIYAQLKDDAGAYQTMDALTVERPALVLAAGTWRLKKLANTAAFGAFSA